MEFGMQLCRWVDIGAGHGQMGEGRVKEDDGIVAKGIERTLIVDEVESA